MNAVSKVVFVKYKISQIKTLNQEILCHNRKKLYGLGCTSVTDFTDEYMEELLSLEYTIFRTHLLNSSFTIFTYGYLF